MAAARDDYLLALYDLSKADPSRWATFVEAFKTYTMYELERSLSTPTSDIAIAFGYSRCITQLRNDCVNIDALASKLRK